MSKVLVVLALAAMPGIALADNAKQPVSPFSIDVSGSTTQAPDLTVQRDASVNVHLPDSTTTITGNFGGPPDAQQRTVGIASTVKAPAGLSLNFKASSQAQDVRLDGALVPEGLRASSAMSETSSAEASATSHPLAGVTLTTAVSENHVITSSTNLPDTGAAQMSAVEADTHAVSAHAGWAPTPWLNVDAGDKSETVNVSARDTARLNQQYRYDEPIASASLKLWDGAQVKATTEEAVSPVNTADYAGVAAAMAAGGLAPHIAPSRELRKEFGFEQSIGDAKLSASVTDARVQSTTELAMTPMGAVTPTSVSGERKEADLNLSLPLSGLGLANTRVESQATWRSSRVRDPVTGQIRAISGEIPRQASVRLVHKDERHHLQFGVTGSLGTDQTIYQPSAVTQLHTASGVGAFVQYKPGKYALSFNVDGLVGGNRSQNDTYYGYLRGGNPSHWDHIENNEPQVSLSLSRSF